MPRKIEISHRTILFMVSFLVFLWFLYLIRDIILAFFVSLLIMAIINPTVTKLSRYKVPRALSVILVYFLVFGIFGLALSSLIPPLVEQSSVLVTKLPDYLSNVRLPEIYKNQVESQLIAQLGSLPGQIVRLSLSFFSNLLTVITVLIFAFYLLLARDKLDDQLAIFIGEKKKANIARSLDLLENRLGGWARAQLILMIIVGILNFIGLTILGIPFALPLSILAGILEIVPTIGPVLASLPAIFIGFSISPVMGLATAALAFIIQQIENYVLVPKVMEKSLGVSPIATLLVLAIGFRLAGITGAVISVPVFITIQVLTKQHLSKEN